MESLPLRGYSWKATTPFLQRRTIDGERGCACGVALSVMASVSEMRLALEKWSAEELTAVIEDKRGVKFASEGRVVSPGIQALILDPVVPKWWRWSPTKLERMMEMAIRRGPPACASGARRRRRWGRGAGPDTNKEIFCSSGVFVDRV